MFYYKIHRKFTYVHIKLYYILRKNKTCVYNKYILLQNNIILLFYLTLIKLF